MNNQIDSHRIQRLIEKLEAFKEGKNSFEFANEILGDFIEMFYENDEIFNVADSFAQYRPGGGEFLFNKKDMESKCKYLIKSLKRYQLNSVGR